MDKSKHTASEKLKIIKKYEEEFYTLREVAALFELSISTLEEWRRVYRHGGVEVLENRDGRTKYPKELKIQVVHHLLERRESLMSAILKYNISGKSVLRRWITNLKESSSMNQGINNTFEERVATVLDCIQSEKDYQAVAQTHRVSYQQLYSWVRKYEKDGADALIDSRGCKKTEEVLTEAERFAIEKKRLEHENERLQMELAFLKKLEEIEKRRR